MSTFGAVWGLLFKNVLYTAKLPNPKQTLYAVQEMQPPPAQSEMAPLQQTR